MRVTGPYSYPSQGGWNVEKMSADEIQSEYERLEALRERLTHTLAESRLLQQTLVAVVPDDLSPLRVLLERFKSAALRA